MNCLICRDLLRAFGTMFDEVPRCSFFCVLDPPHLRPRRMLILKRARRELEERACLHHRKVVFQYAHETARQRGSEQY